jgi:hypothetical protein
VSPFWYVTGVSSLVLELLVAVAIVQRRLLATFPFIFLYCLSDFCFSLPQWGALLGIAQDPFAVYYWANESVVQFLTFAVMITLIHKGLEGTPGRWIVPAAITAVVLGVLLITTIVLQQQGASTNRTMNAITRNLAFCSALSNMVLWAVLMRRRVNDWQVLLVSAGLGLLTTGKAIGISLSLIARSAVPIGNVVTVFSALLCLLIWLATFLRAKAGGQVRRAGGFGEPR